jgi:hypothetical protein
LFLCLRWKVRCRRIFKLLFTDADLYIFIFTTVAILTPTPGEEEIRRMAEFVQNEGPGLAAYPVLPTHPDTE